MTHTQTHMFCRTAHRCIRKQQRDLKKTRTTCATDACRHTHSHMRARESWNIILCNHIFMNGDDIAIIMHGPTFATVPRLANDPTYSDTLAMRHDRSCANDFASVVVRLHWHRAGNARCMCTNIVSCQLRIHNCTRHTNACAMRHACVVVSHHTHQDQLMVVHS